MKNFLMLFCLVGLFTLTANSASNFGLKAIYQCTSRVIKTVYKLDNGQEYSNEHLYAFTFNVKYTNSQPTKVVLYLTKRLLSATTDKVKNCSEITEGLTWDPYCYPSTWAYPLKWTEVDIDGQLHRKYEPSEPGIQDFYIERPWGNQFNHSFEAKIHFRDEEPFSMFCQNMSNDDG